MDSDGAVDLLKRLKDLPITLEVLQKTRIGMSVNTLRKKSENSDLQTQAKALIKSWKKLLPGDKVHREWSLVVSFESFVLKPIPIRATS